MLYDTDSRTFHNCPHHADEGRGQIARHLALPPLRGGQPALRPAITCLATIGVPIVTDGRGRTRTHAERSRFLPCKAKAINKGLKGGKQGRPNKREGAHSFFTVACILLAYKDPVKRKTNFRATPQVNQPTNQLSRRRSPLGQCNVAVCPSSAAADGHNSPSLASGRRRDGATGGRAGYFSSARLSTGTAYSA